MRLLLTTVVGLIVLSVIEASAGENPVAKAAVHVLYRDPGRTCAVNFPDIGSCEEISTTHEGCQEIDIFPVFFDLAEYKGIEYGLSWPGSHSCAFTSCSYLTIGQIVSSGDGISHAWAQCKFGPVAITGWGWISQVDYGSICIVAHPLGGDINIGDCSGVIDHAIASFCAGVCGGIGDVPCETIIQPLNLGKTDGLDGECVGAGDTMTYTISYDNTTNMTEVHEVVLADYLPAQAEYASSSAGGSYDAGAHKVTWDLGTLPPGSMSAVELIAVVSEGVAGGTTLTNRCEIAGWETPVTEATQYTDVCVHDFAPLNLGKTHWFDGDCADPGDTITYTISYDNQDNVAEVHNAVLIDYLSASTQYVSCSDGGTYEAGVHSVNWNLGTLGPGDADSVELVVLVSQSTPPGATLVNRCEIATDETQPTEVEDLTDVCIGEFAPLGLGKTDGLTVGCMDPGDSITYTIHYDNLANTSPVHNVTIDDLLPSETEYVSSSSGGTYHAGDHKVTWYVDSLPDGRMDSVWLVVRITPGTTPGLLIANTCGITSDETSVAVASETTQVCDTYFAPLNLSKTDPFGGGCVDSGRNIRYTISYDNKANSSDVHDVTIIDFLPPATDFVSATGNGIYDGDSHTVTWTLGTLAGGLGGTATLVVNVPAATPYFTRLNNRCEITGSETGTTSVTRLTVVCGTAGNTSPKVAVHVEPHASRTCVSNFPTITTCSAIEFSSESSDVDAFPVFFDLEEYQGFEYSMSWPGQYSCVFHSCSDLTIGGIVNPGDGVSHAWYVCLPGPIAVPGWAWVYEESPSQICVIMHPTAHAIGIGDCQGRIVAPIATTCAGIAGAEGEDPCSACRVVPTSWGAIKAMFKK